MVFLFNQFVGSCVILLLLRANSSARNFLSILLLNLPCHRDCFLFADISIKEGPETFAWLMDQARQRQQPANNAPGKKKDKSYANWIDAFYCVVWRDLYNSHYEKSPAFKLMILLFRWNDKSKLSIISIIVTLKFYAFLAVQIKTFACTTLCASTRLCWIMHRCWK